MESTLSVIDRDDFLIAAHRSTAAGYIDLLAPINKRSIAQYGQLVIVAESFRWQRGFWLDRFGSLWFAKSQILNSAQDTSGTKTKFLTVVLYFHAKCGNFIGEYLLNHTDINSAPNLKIHIRTKIPAPKSSQYSTVKYSLLFSRFL